MSTGIMDQSMEYLADVHNTYGRLYGISSTFSLSTSEQKVPLNTFTLSSGCTLSSNGIKVPANGVYVIEGSAYAYTGFTVNDIIHILLYVNSSSRLESQKRIMSANPYETIVTGQLMISLSAGDVIYLYAYNQTGARGTIGNAASTKLVVHRIA